MSALKYQLDSLEGVDEATQGLYTEKDGKYVLAVDGLPEPEDVSGLKSALEKEREHRRKAVEAREAAERAAEEASRQKAKKDGDVEALEESWTKKLQTLEEERKAERGMLTSALKQATVDRTAMDLATKLAVPGSAEALLPVIAGRLSMEFKDGKAVPVVLGPDGKPSALTVDDLGKEVAAMGAYAPLIAATKASGGGATGAAGGGATSVTKAAQMTTAEKSAFISKHGLQAWKEKVEAEAKSASSTK